MKLFFSRRIGLGPNGGALLAAAVAEALARVPIVSPLMDGAQLAAMRPAEAAAFDGLI